MKNGRKRYGNDFKAKMAMEVLKEQKTMAEISSHYRVHPSQLMKWKKKVLEALPGIFSGNGKNNSGNDEALTADLYQQIGQLKVEMDWLKKIWGYRLTR